MGAGVFAAFGPAARAAGAGLLIGLATRRGDRVLQRHRLGTVGGGLSDVPAAPTSMGAEQLGPWWGFAAGCGFLIGKTASCAAMALTIGAYALPGPWWAQRLVAVTAVVVADRAELPRYHQDSGIGAESWWRARSLPLPCGHRHRDRWYAAVESERCGRLVIGNVVRGSAIGRVAVLRVRRLCADRDDGRGGP